MPNLDYELDRITKTPSFLSAPEDIQQDVIRSFRDDYIKEHPEEAEYAQAIAENRNKTFLRSTGRGRHIPTNLKIDAPWQSPDFEFLTENERQTEIEKFKLKIPEIASQDTLNKEDNEFYLNQVADAQIRAVKGEDTGYAMDKAYRAFDGFAAGMANYVGATEIADNIRRSTSENPKYDEDFMATLAQGAGDMAASTAIFLGAALGTTAITGSPVAGGYAGTAATLATNGISRYNEAYRIAIEKGLNDNQAHEAGIFSLPGAAVDALGDKLIASKLLPARMTRNFNVPDGVAKRQALTELIADKSKRGVVMEVARNAFVEGASEAVGDYTAGYGGFLATGETDYLPSNTDLAKSFAVGAILGGGISAISDTPALLRGDSDKLSTIGENVDKLPQDKVSKVYELLAQGNYKDALTYSKEALSSVAAVTPTETAEAEDAKPGDVKPGEKPIAEKPVFDKPDSQKPTEININSKPEDVEVDESVFLAKDEKTEEKQQAAATVETKEGETRDKKEERAATAVLDKMKAESKAYFKNTVVKQVRDYLTKNSIADTIINLGKVSPETNAPAKNIRVGTGNIGANRQREGALFVREQSAKVNNISIVDPTAIVNPKGVADFSVLDRAVGNEKPKGELNVETSGIATKVEEAVALGRANDIVAIAPVNNKDQNFLQDNNIPFLDLSGVKGLNSYEYEEGTEKLYQADTVEGLKELVKKLDKAYGVGKWALKNSVGFGGKNSVFTNEEQLIQAFNENTQELTEEEKKQQLTSNKKAGKLAVDELLKNVADVDVEITSTVAETGAKATYSQKASTILEETKKEKIGYETLINCLVGKK